ncbi:hypothetical protein JKP88DRAFT_247224 [Tribonema minus]|uniref:Uncharacterized protein n=1 Tax=Tribonema minus TaxID=303371 RepID=A0A836CBH5_9STRA|nr:hypothetical protein JKP88DRAFT_247224 [Tribonema minus]
MIETKAAILANKDLVRRLAMRTYLRYLARQQPPRLLKAQENLAKAWLASSKQQYADEIEWRTEFISMCQPYMTLTSEEEQLQQEGPEDLEHMLMPLVPVGSDRKLNASIGFSDLLPTELKLLFNPLLTDRGVTTWEEALRLDETAPCFEGIPPRLVARLLRVIDHVQRRDAKASARAALLHRVIDIGRQVILSPVSVTELDSPGGDRRMDV